MASQQNQDLIPWIVRVGGSWWIGKIGLRSFQGYRKSSALLYPSISSPSSSYIIIITIWLAGWLSLSRMFSSLGFQAPPPSTCLCHWLLFCRVLSFPWLYQLGPNQKTHKWFKQKNYDMKNCFILVYHFRRRQWQPTPVLLPGKSHGRRNLVGCSPWGCQE